MSEESQTTPLNPAQTTEDQKISVENQPELTTVNTPESIESKPAETPASPDTNGQTGPKGIAWDQVFLDFSTSDEKGNYPSLRDLSEKYGVSLSTIGMRSSDENWVAKRNENITQSEQEAARIRSSKIVNADSRHLEKYQEIQDTADRLLKGFQSKIDKYDAAQEKLKDETITPEEKKKLEEITSPGPGQLFTITLIMKTAIDGERVVLGLATTVTKDLTPKGIVTLSPEMVADIDELFKKNGHPGTTNPITNS